jgi:hypothetical protein
MHNNTPQLNEHPLLDLLENVLSLPIWHPDNKQQNESPSKRKTIEPTCEKPRKRISPTPIGMKTNVFPIELVSNLVPNQVDEKKIEEITQHISNMMIAPKKKIPFKHIPKIKRIIVDPFTCAEKLYDVYKDTCEKETDSLVESFFNENEKEKEQIQFEEYGFLEDPEDNGTTTTEQKSSELTKRDDEHATCECIFCTRFNSTGNNEKHSLKEKEMDQLEMNQSKENKKENDNEEKREKEDDTESVIFETSEYEDDNVSEGSTDFCSDQDDNDSVIFEIDFETPVEDAGNISEDFFSDEEEEETQKFKERRCQEDYTKKDVNLENSMIFSLVTKVALQETN